jgi:hypothetical protein
MIYEYIFVYIVLPLIIIIKKFHVRLYILDKVVSSLYANFGTPCMWELKTNIAKTVFTTNI